MFLTQPVAVATQSRLHPKGTSSRCFQQRSGARCGHGTPLPYDLKLPGLRQRRLSPEGMGPAWTNLALTGFLSGWFHTAPPFECAECIRGLGKMNVNGTARGGHFNSSSECRPVPAGMNRSCDRPGSEDGPTASCRSASKGPYALWCHCTRSGHG